MLYATSPYVVNALPAQGFRSVSYAAPGPSMRSPDGSQETTASEDDRSAYVSSRGLAATGSEAYRHASQDSHGQEGSKRQRSQIALFGTSPQNNGGGHGDGKANDNNYARHPSTQPENANELDIPEPDRIA